MQTGLLVFTDFVGIVAFALAGILAAEGKNVDPVGVFVMAFTTAFGGGIVRDLIIDNRPMYWIAHEEYVWVTLLMTAVAPVVIRRFRDKTLHTLFVWSDAVGLGFFAAGGTSLSLTAGLPALASVLMGVCTGVFGGLLDICPLLNMDNLGRLIPRSKIRGKKRVMKEIVARMEEHAQGGLDYSGKCYISQSACYDDARAVADEIEKKFPKLNGKVEIYSVGTTIGSHTGPGTVALFFWGDERKD